MRLQVRAPLRPFVRPSRKADGTYDDDARLVVAADRMSLVNGDYAEEFGDLHIPSSYLGPDVLAVARQRSESFSLDHEPLERCPAAQPEVGG